MNYKDIYYKEMGLDKEWAIPCEVCNAPATEIHHITPRGMGGSKKRDNIENLMAVCRACHNEADFGTELPREKLQKIHLSYIEYRSRSNNKLQDPFKR